MLKLPTLIALFVCFVYSNNEHNVDTNLEVGKLQLPGKEDNPSKNTFHTVKGHYLEEKKRTKPCKKNNNRRLDDNKDLDVFESLPLTATTEQINTASIGNKVITSTIHGANYNYKNENPQTDDSDLHSTKCDCNDCLLEANKKVLEFESLALDSNNNPLNNVAHNIETSEFELAHSNTDPFDNGGLDVSLSEGKNNDNIADVEKTKPCNNAFTMNTRRRKCGKNKVSENLSNKSTYRRILPGIIENPTEEETEDYKLYQDGPQSDHNDEIESRQNNFPNVHKISNSYDIDLVHNMNINEVPEQSTLLEDTVESQLIEPTRGKGIYDMKDEGVMLLENSRVCYACSTMSDPTCWRPDKRTTVKYCHKGHRSCLTKSFKHRGKSVIIRDCGSYCVNFPNGEENYSSCSICHSDLCNSGSPMSIYSTGIILILLFGIFMNTY